MFAGTKLHFFSVHYAVLIVVLIELLVVLSANGRAIRQDEICGEYDGRRKYVELGEYGVLEARMHENDIVKREAQHERCSMELITCPSCIISVKFMFLNISRNCGKNSVADGCGCDYVWIYEPSFEDASGEQFCGHFVYTNSTVMAYKSQTRSMAITFLFSSHHQHAFTLEYSSLRNRHYINGYPKLSNSNNRSQYISSPFFPHYYPRDLNMEYVINCKISEECRVRLIFTDFLISPNSLIEFFDSNGQRMYVATGAIFRPQVLISTGPTITIRFYANGGTNLGYKASYKFLLVSKENSTNEMTPDTDCGGFVDNLGGCITMMNMIHHGTKAYDCIWIIRPPQSYLHLKTQLYLKVNTFSNFIGSTELVVRQGLTSNEPAVETLRHPASKYIATVQKEHVVSISQGFYVSLRGMFRIESSLAIVYSAFNYKDCYSGSDFLCRNLRCIPVYLICDGFDHCGDNSDETTNCLVDMPDRTRWSNTPNFYFPKADRYSYLKTATIAFLVCSFGLVMLICVLVILLYRMNVRNRTQRNLQSHLQTINDMLEEGSSGIMEEEIVISDEPPIYEAPPEYDDLSKKVKKRGRRQSGLRLHRRHACTCYENASINASEFSDEPGTSRSCQTTPLPTLLVPRTPPPQYSCLPTIHLDSAPAYVSNENIVDLQEEVINGNTSQTNRIATSNTEAMNMNFTVNAVKFFSLQNIKATMSNCKKFRSACILNAAYKTGDAIKNRARKHFLITLPLNNKLCLSDSELLMTRGYDICSSSLRRSISIQNLFDM